MVTRLKAWFDAKGMAFVKWTQSSTFNAFQFGLMVGTVFGIGVSCATIAFLLKQGAHK